MMRKATKITKNKLKSKLEVRLRYYIDGNTNEELLATYLEELDNLPYSRREMMIKALSTFFLPLAYQYHEFDEDKLRQVLLDVEYSWNMHFQYLKKKLNLFDYEQNYQKNSEKVEVVNNESRENQSVSVVENEIDVKEEELDINQEIEDFINIFE